MKITFIMPAYNEEKRIGKALSNLVKLKFDYPDMEILVGMDGCTDRTEEIVEMYEPYFVKSFKTKKRRGKHYIIDKLIKMAAGDIIAVHDADRIFNCGEGELEKLLDCFKDPRVGGVGDYYTTTFNEENMRHANALYLGDAWNTLFMLEYKIKNQSKNTMFYVNFFRRELAEPTKTLCDDGERYIQLLRGGYNVRLLRIEETPNFKTVYNKMSFWGFAKTKVRGFIASRQIKKAYGGCWGPSIFMLIYILKNLTRVKRLRALYGVFLWWLAVLIARVWYQFINKDMTTQEGWVLRMK